MGHNYSLPTIKTLFGEASRCAYPGCPTPLVFRDRGAATVTAQIAHIRSEKTGGPRYDPSYPGEIDGAENLLLLCGEHHPPVDRHESLYSIGELEAWKTAQREGARVEGGTEISVDDARRFSGASAEERQTMTAIAKLVERMIRARQDGADLVLKTLDAWEQERRAQGGRMLAGVSEVDEQGNRSPASIDRFSLPRVQTDRWRDELRAALVPYQQRTSEAHEMLVEEIAVLEMFAGPLEVGGHILTQSASTLLKVPYENDIEEAVADLKRQVQRMWRIANGDDVD